MSEATKREFRHSEHFGKLIEALSKAQGTMTPAHKDSENPFFESKYADLSAIWEACRGPLSANGLAVLQFPRTVDSGVEIETVLGHSSGEWVAETLWAPLAKKDPQGVGSGITYLRRYALASICGIAPDDDDGNASAQSDEPKQRREKPKKNGEPEKPSNEHITPQQCEALTKLIADRDVDMPKLLEKYAIKSLAELPTIHYADCYWKVKRKPQKILLLPINAGEATQLAQLWQDKGHHNEDELTAFLGCRLAELPPWVGELFRLVLETETSFEDFLKFGPEHPTTALMKLVESDRVRCLGKLKDIKQKQEAMKRQPQEVTA